jgi:hypothetical protein
MVVNIPCVRMAEALSAAMAVCAVVQGPRLATKTLLWPDLTPYAAPTAMTALVGFR